MTEDALPDSPTDPEMLSVCFRCRPEGWRGEDCDRPGVRLADRIEAAAMLRGTGLAVLRDVRCMSQCNRPCVIAFSHPDKFTFLFGDLDPDRDVPAILDAFELYCDRPDGFMERSERPVPMRAGILGRIPPLLSKARLVEPRPIPPVPPLTCPQMP